MQHMQLLAFLALLAPVLGSSQSAPLRIGRHSMVSGGPEILVPPSDPSVWTTGRFLKNPDGTLSYDWENSQMHLNVANASYVKVLINSTGGILGKIFGEVDGWEVTQQYVGGGNPAVVNTNEFLVGFDLYGTRHIRVTSSLEPAFEGANENAYFTFLGFKTDGFPLPATPRTRKIELVGDSISAGYGARGYGGAGVPPPPYGCPVDDNTSGNRYTYNHMLAENFTAELTAIAWSGKGMYENCCDSGIKMPSLYLQTLGGRSYSTDWDFSTYIPDMMIINLGTNDFGHDSGPAWEANFTSTYVEFVLNATTRYNSPKLPIFLAQGNMNNGAPLHDALQSAITQINAAGGAAYYLDMRGPIVDGCGGHPGVNGHAGMFQMAQPVIAKVMGW